MLVEVKGYGLTCKLPFLTFPFVKITVMHISYLQEMTNTFNCLHSYIWPYWINS